MKGLIPSCANLSHTLDNMPTSWGIVHVATCQLNQWALDFPGNLERVKQSICIAKSRGARFRTGPELELCGYGCEDHFLENDTVDHCWESLAAIINDKELTKNILCDIGMPVIFRSVRYNCRVFVLNNEILLIRPKVVLSGDGNYREFRYFAAWNSEDHELYEMSLEFLRPLCIDQKSTKFGIGVIECSDATIGSETCEELWTLQAPHISMMLDGVDIIANGSGSHHELRKLKTRLDLIRSATAKGGGCYLYSNQIGCDGGRLYFDGSALIALNGEVIELAPQFGLKEVEVLTTAIDIKAIRSFRCRTASLMAQAASTTPLYHRVSVDFSLGSQEKNRLAVVKGPINSLNIASPMEEIANGPACWLWDYLRRSGACGYFVPLSGGADSAAVATIVAIMCERLYEEIINGDEDVMSEIERVIKVKRNEETFPKSSKELCNIILHTCYMGSTNSSSSSRELAQNLAEEIGSYHLTIAIDIVINAFLTVFELAIGKIPRFISYGGSPAEDVALQNIQARIRMVFSYLLASLLPWVRHHQGYLLVLGTGNVDEALRGYLTKYDCSSADINPIGSISKVDLVAFLQWAHYHLEYKSLEQIVQAKPTAELRPILVNNQTKSHSQTDEEDMGLTYAELSIFGKLRKLHRCGPVSMIRSLIYSGSYAPSKIISLAEKVKHFFIHYARNRHKMTTITPSYHAEGYSPDDNRFDHRQFLYPKFERQFSKIDEIVQNFEKQE